MTTTEKIMVTIGGVIFGYALYVSNKCDQVANKLDRATDEVMKRSEVEISDDIVTNAVKKAVKKEVTAKVKDAADSAVEKMKGRDLFIR